ncbi:MAG TPA: thioredoxin-disulfide reductase [Planctomycetota bacterium]|nr:thioredoxin-disulfide reductase [Planctomycetota bacterium]
MTETFDLIIVGGGPASLSAAIYGGRAEMRTLVLERLMVGGQVATTWQVDNYPGFPEGVEGPELIQRMEAQAKRFGAEIRNEEVKRIELDGKTKVVTTDKNAYRSPTLILATGADPRKLEVPGEDALRGRGVSYCGTCDAPFFREKEVVVVGGGDAALTEALFIARFATRITLVHRRDEFRGEKIHQTAVEENPKITVAWDTVVDRINGKDRVESVTLRNVKTDETRELKCDGVFIFIGHQPNTAFLCNLFGEECTGEIETGYDMQTSIPGLFAIGDVRKNSYRQIATAVGEGATAAIAAEHYIAEHARGRKN